MSRPLSPLPSVLLAAGALAFAGCQWLIHAYAPLEAQLGLMQKIFYVHLPLAWWALISFFVVFAGSVAVLVRGSQSADRLCRAAAEVVYNVNMILNNKAQQRNIPKLCLDFWL